MRDPRIDPQPGDILRNKDREALVVMIRGPRIYVAKCKAGEESCKMSGWLTLDDFRANAKDAEVVLCL